MPPANVFPGKMESKSIKCLYITSSTLVALVSDEIFQRHAVLYCKTSLQALAESGEGCRLIKHSETLMQVIKIGGHSAQFSQLAYDSVFWSLSTPSDGCGDDCAWALSMAFASTSLSTASAAACFCGAAAKSPCPSSSASSSSEKQRPK